MDTGKVTVIAVVLLGVAGAAVPAIATAQTATSADGTDATTADSGTADSPGNGTGNDSAAFGTQLTAFMQSSAAETNDTVESGMWEAGFERADESRRDRMARSRTDELGDRLEQLRDRNRTLTERYENGSIERDEYVARASSLSGRLSALRESIDGTDRAARAAGVNETRLDALRKNTTNVTGPEVPGVARGIVSGDRGPPADRGNRPGDVPGVGPGNANETGNASVANGNGVANGNDRGPPDDAGRPDDAGGGGPNPKGGVGGKQSVGNENSQANENAGPDSNNGRSQGNDRAGESDRGERSTPGSGGDGSSEDSDADESDDESDDTPAGGDDGASDQGSDANDEDGDGESVDSEEGGRDKPGRGPPTEKDGSRGPSIVTDPFGVVVDL